MLVYLAIQSLSRIPSQRTSSSSSAVVAFPFSSQHLKEDDNNIHHFRLLSRYNVTSKFAVDSVSLGRWAQIRKQRKSQFVWSRKFTRTRPPHHFDTSMHRFNEKFRQQVTISPQSNSSQTPFEWVTDNDPAFSYGQLLDNGGFGEVHEVNLSAH